MSADRPTPDTDAVAYHVLDANDEHPQGISYAVDGSHVCSDFARRLERDRDEARERLRWEQEERRAWKTSCEDYHAANKDIILEREKLIRQRDRLLEALEKQACLTAYYNGHSDGYKQHPNGGLFWENYLCPEARSAIAEVEVGR